MRQIGENMRKYYIDNLRWLCIVLLLPFHAAMAWNSWGEGNYIYYEPNQALSTFLIMIAQWYMPLLFVLAGMSARYALQKRSYRAFVLERVEKLLLPLITGMLTVVAVMTFYADRSLNEYQGDFLQHYKIFFSRFTTLTGYDGGWTPGHLWFLLYLFLISMLCLGIIVLQRRWKSDFSLKNMPLIWLLLLAIPVGLSDLILNIAEKSICKFLLLFLIGYYIFSEEENLERISKHRYLSWGVMLIASIAATYMFIWMDSYNSMICSIFSDLACWFGILAVVGSARLHFNVHNGVTQYLTRRSFLIYILHFMWLVILQYYLIPYMEHTGVVYFASWSGALVLTLVTCEVIIRIPGVRFLFGVHQQKPLE